MQAAIVGAGAAGILHALSLRAHGASIGHVFDPDHGRAAALAELFSATVHPSIESLAASPADLVTFASPPFLHVPQVETCARDGRWLVVEKPLALDEEEWSRLARVERCIPVFQWRLGRGLRAIRAALRGGHFGPSPSVSADLSWSRDADYLATRGSRARWGCGALLSVGIHALDAICFALESEPVWVRARACAQAPAGAGAPTPGAATAAAGMRSRPSDQVETVAVVAAQFASGALLSLRVTLESGRDETTLAFAGNGVTATLRGGEADPTVGPVTWCAPPDRAAELVALERGIDGYGASPLLVPYVGHCLEAIRRGRSPVFPAVPRCADAAGAHRLAFEAARSWSDRPSTFREIAGQSVDK